MNDQSSFCRLIFVTGGARSGKSTYAERLALSLDAHPVYLATARVWDDEFAQRVARHQQRRGAEWTNIEEPLHLSQVPLEGRTVLLDCLTLWATNAFFERSELPAHEQVDQTLQWLKSEFEALLSKPTTLIVVSNELGSGGTSANAVQRHFTDLMGWLNQHVASLADEVVLMVSGLPLTLKKQGQILHTPIDGEPKL